MGTEITPASVFVACWCFFGMGCWLAWVIDFDCDQESGRGDDWHNAASSW